MAGPVDVVGRLARILETGTTVPAEVDEAPPGQELLRIALVADVKDQLVATCKVEGPKQRDRHFDRPEVARKVAPVGRGLSDDLASDVVAEKLQGLGAKRFDHIRVLDIIYIDTDELFFHRETTNKLLIFDFVFFEDLVFA